MYTTRFLRYLPSQDDLLRSLMGSVLASPSCLVCFEADYRYCHRSFVANRLQQLSRGVISDTNELLKTKLLPHVRCFPCLTLRQLLLMVKF